MQLQEKSTPFKPHPPPHLTGTKRSLYRDLENQFLASRAVSDTATGGRGVSEENKDPVSHSSKYSESLAAAEHGMTEPAAASMKSGQVSVIRKAPSSVQTPDSTQLQKRSGCLVEITDNQLAAGSCTSPKKQAEQEARYASALALIQLAHGHS